MADTLTTLLLPQNETAIAACGASGAWRWESLVDGVIKQVWIDSQHDRSITKAYVQTLIEALRQGLLSGWYSPGNRPHIAIMNWNSWLEFLLLVVFPEGVGGCAAADRIARLAEVWNLGENVHRAEPWIEPLILHYAKAAPPVLATLEDQMSAWLEPHLQVPSDVCWTPPYRVEVIKPDRERTEFLPGEMFAAAPAIVGVHDRSNPGSMVAVVLGKAGPLILSLRGAVAALPMPRVTVRLAACSAFINDAEVPLPNLFHPRSHVVLPCGAIVINAVDSQRLWVIQPGRA